MASDKIISRIEGAVAHLIFNNPERRNAVSLDMWEAAGEALDTFAADREVRLVILSGAGGKAFVSGADISRFEAERASEAAIAHYHDTSARIFDKLEHLPVPTIARIDGYCVGGGVGIAVACDLRICGESAQFAVPAARLGLGYGHVGVRRLIDLVGPAATKEIFFTARMYSAAEALGMGLVNRVVADAELDAAMADYGARITANAPLTVSSIKTIVGELMKDADRRDLDRCEAVVKACFDSNDYVEGRRAFLEKRPPKFTGA